MAKAKKNPDIPELREQIESLRAEIEAHSRAYYGQDNPTIGDFEFDQLMQRLRTLEAMAPDLATPDSPSRKVGGAISTDLATTRHTVPLLSLQDVFAESEVADFITRMQSDFPEVRFVVERKIDSLLVAISY